MGNIAYTKIVFERNGTQQGPLIHEYWTKGRTNGSYSYIFAS